jgi:hypothetical protein
MKNNKELHIKNLDFDFYHLTVTSKNEKTGPIAVTTSSKYTCPDVCPLKKKGCYADSGPLQLHWELVTNQKRGVSFDYFLILLLKLKRFSELRYGQAGDLPKIKDNTDTIDNDKLSRLTAVIKQRKLKAYAYTHFPVINHVANQEAIKAANNNGFTINLSANNISEVDSLLSLNIAPVAVIMNQSAPKVSYTDQGNKIVICPAQTNTKTTCMDCMLCQKNDRDFSIGFYPHGVSVKKAIISTNNQ